MPAQSAGYSSKQFPSQSWKSAAYVQSPSAPKLQADSSSHVGIAPPTEKEPLSAPPEAITAPSMLTLQEFSDWYEPSALYVTV